ncbi:MAG: hypothetical protein GMKNLPBB_01057 [Myxococcota bacterium]|nr:hypothetical protein [Myxococcota bacterium]
MSGTQGQSGAPRIAGVRIIAAKELRGYFVSPVAMIFLSIFLVASLFTFFWVDGFFARNLADIRPLFEWMPALLIFLVAALTMRQWSDEQKMGTMELLFTLPVPTWKMVLGKFLAGWALMGVALALTVGIPLSVATMGDLDWGPVIGGYAGAMMLAGAYLAIGLFVSSTTDNQIVSLMVTLVLLGLLYLAGAPQVTALAGAAGAEILSSIGAGSRFASIARGVFDLRDIFYYLSITGAFLTLNTYALESKRLDRNVSGERGLLGRRVLAGLVALNLLLPNLWIAPASAARLDITQRGEYSISTATKTVIQGLQDPVTIIGYFSGKTHPLLQPLVPRIRDLIKEYESVGRGVIRTRFIDPRENEEEEKEANETYGIKSIPFRISERHQDAVVNSYFNIVVRQGDEHVVLGFQELIEVSARGPENIEVKLQNPEYAITRAIKRVSEGFQSLENVFARLEEKAELTAVISPQTLPDDFKKIPEMIDKVAREIQGRSGGKLEYKVVNPDVTRQDTPQEIYNTYRIKPMMAGLFSNDYFYLHLFVKVGAKAELIPPQADQTEADIRKNLEAALRRRTPGFLKTIGMVVPRETPQQPMFPGQMPPQPREGFQTLRRALSENYTVETVDLSKGVVPPHIDVLLLMQPEKAGDKERFAVDQFLMRGGNLVAVTSGYKLDMSSMGKLAVVKVESGLEDLLKHYGVIAGKDLVLDTQNHPLPVPVERSVGGFRVQEIKLFKYPYFVDIRSDGFDKDNPILSGLPGVAMHFASALRLEDKPKLGDRKVSELIRSSENSWTTSSSEVQPDFEKYPETGFADPPADRARQLLGVAMTGSFDSYFADKPSPLFGTGADKEKDGKAADRTGRTLKKSPDTAKLVVLSSTEFVNDTILMMSRQMGSDQGMLGVKLIENIIDWSLEDATMLGIRSRGTVARTLRPMEKSAQEKYEWINYLTALIGLAVVFGMGVQQRRARRMDLLPREEALGGKGGEA